MNNLSQTTIASQGVAESDLFRKLFESSGEGVIILDTQGTIVDVNPALPGLTGYQRHELTGQPVEKLFPRGSGIFHPETDAKQKQVLEVLHKKGELLPVMVSIRQVRSGEKSFAIGFITDAREQIRAAQERVQFSRIFDESVNEIYIFDADTWQFLSVNKGALHHLGYTLEEMQAMSICDINPALCEEEIRKLIHPLEAGMKNKITYETMRRRKDGTVYPVEVHLQYTWYLSRKAFLALALDITERKNMQQKIMGALVTGQEKERRRIAKELHDSFGQYLSAVNFNLNTLGFHLKEDPKGRKVLDNLHMIIECAVEELKSISKNLYPRVLESYGLVKALQSLCESVSHSDELRIHLQMHGLEERLPQTVEMGLYRISQELINNMLKHANASEASLQLVRHEDSIVLLMEDDGKGFDTSGINENVFEGSGIRNITSQVKALDGIFHFDSGLGKGTSVTIEIPLAESRSWIPKQ